MKGNDQDECASIHNMPADRAEPEWRESDEQFRELMSHLQQVFWIKNAVDDSVLYISPAYEKICGRTCQSLYDNFQTFLDSIHPLDRERVAGAMAGQRETGGYEEEYRIVRPDGAIRWIWARSYPVRDGQGQVIRFAGIAEDISDRKSLEQDRARLAAIVEYSEDAIVSMSVDCIIISWNRGAERQYGYTAEEIIGRSLSVLFPPDHYEEYLQILKDVRQGKPVAEYETARRRKDGTLIDTCVKIFPIEVRDREVVGVSKISRDVTAIKKLEAQFIEAQKMEVVGQLAAGMAHDFNNLLFVILNLSDQMMQKLEAGAPLLKDAETIRQAAERAARLTRQLLVFSRRESAAPVVLDLNDVVKSQEKMLRQIVDEYIDLTIVRGAQVGRVRADSGYLGQLLLNLAANARDAMPDGGKLAITTSNATLDDAYARLHTGVIPGNYVRLSVSDTGTGISAQARAHLFEPFFTTKPKGKGTGLGLATCDIIVKQCGGHIGVSSEPGSGTTFEVYLPVAGEPLAVSTQPPGVGEAVLRGMETLLVIEGERDVRNLICSAMESLGYTALRASNGQEGLRVARENKGSPVRLVISDVSLPQMGGNLMAEWLKLAGPELCFIFTSGYADDAVAPQGPPAERLAYHPKPCTSTKLACLVRTMLDHREGMMA